MTYLREPGAMVFGLGFSGVGALHSLSEMCPRPDPVIGVDSNPREIGFASRVGPMIVAPPPWQSDGGALRDFLLHVSDEYTRQFVLYPCGDDYVRFVMKHADALRPRFLFLTPDPETVEVLLNKSRFADFARSIGIPVPACATVEGVAGLRLPKGMRFPIVAKSLTSLHDDPFWGVLRVKQFDTPEAWDEFFGQHGKPSAVVTIQELVVGDDEHQFVYEGLWSAESEPIEAFTVRKIRQQPRNYGSSARAVSELDPEVVLSSEKLLRAAQYRGLVDIDYKRDERDGRLWIMEVNPRLGGVHRVGRSCGINLVQDAYRLAVGEAVQRRTQPAGARGHWCHLSKDIRGLLPELKGHPGLLFPWLRSYFPPPMDALFTWRDPGPWALAMWRLAQAGWREIRAGAFGEHRVS